MTLVNQIFYIVIELMAIIVIDTLYFKALAQFV